jgi:hypothetical protein
MESFRLFRNFRPNGSSIVSTNDYTSAEEPYFDFELLFLVAPATSQDRVLRVVLYKND